MEDILEKLKLLNYEKDLCSQQGLKPLTRAYFAIQQNSNEQFVYFKTLIRWIFQLNNINVEFSQYDDPITVAS